MAATAYRLIRLKKLLTDASASNRDLILNSGEFILDATGIVARFRGPLARYSRHFDWPVVPFGLAALRALMEDIRLGEAGTFDLICRRFGLSEAATEPFVEEVIGKVEWFIGPDDPDETVWHESDLMEDAQRLILWGEQIVEHCPNEVVAHQLHALTTMSRKDLGQYVSRMLG